MNFSRRRLLKAAVVAPLFLSSNSAIAQAYPTRPIRLVVPFPPGGAFDFVGRPWAEKVKSSLGTVVIENIGGGGSSLGAAAVVRSPADGYTILLGGTQTHVNEALLKSRPFMIRPRIWTLSPALPPIFLLSLCTQHWRCKRFNSFKLM